MPPPPADSWTEDERALLDAMLDRLIPESPNRGLPSAGQLGVADFLAARRHDSPELAELFTKGLAAIRALVEERTAEGIGALAPEDQDAILFALQNQEPSFFMAFLRQSYMGYYSHPSVPPQFGLPDRPPQPLGHKVPPNEGLDQLLAPVRARGKHWRDA